MKINNIKWRKKIENLEIEKKDKFLIEVFNESKKYTSPLEFIENLEKSWKMVYHWTWKIFDEFEDKCIWDNYWCDKVWFFFTSSLEEAQWYANSSLWWSPNIKKVLLNIKNPYKKESLYCNSHQYYDLMRWWKEHKEIITWNKHDGIIIKNIIANEEELKSSWRWANNWWDLYVSFNINQIITEKKLKEIWEKENIINLINNNKILNFQNITISENQTSFKEIWTCFLKDYKWNEVIIDNKVVWKLLIDSLFKSRQEQTLYIDWIESYEKWIATKIIFKLFLDNNIKKMEFVPLKESVDFWKKLWSQEISSSRHILSKYEFLNYLSWWKIDKNFWRIYKEHGTKKSDQYVNSIENIDLNKYFL